MEFDLDRIIKGDRSTASYYHFHVARGWRIIGESRLLHSPLSYSAFEFRSAIERIVVELLVLIKKGNVSPAELEQIQRFSGLRNFLLTSAGGKRTLYRALRFNRILTQIIGVPANLCPSVPDITVLEKYWTRLSEYCHKQLSPYTTWESQGNHWIHIGYALLKEVENYLWQITISSPLGWFREETLPQDLIPTRTQFIEGSIEENALVTRIKLLEPAVQMRARRLFSP